MSDQPSQYAQGFLAQAYTALPTVYGGPVSAIRLTLQDVQNSDFLNNRWNEYKLLGCMTDSAELASGVFYVTDYLPFPPAITAELSYVPYSKTRLYEMTPRYTTSGGFTMLAITEPIRVFGPLCQFAIYRAPTVAGNNLELFNLTGTFIQFFFQVNTQ